MAGLPMAPDTVSFFHGRITREESERILASNGYKEGMYLLRESVPIQGNYAVSLCHSKKVHHYSIERQQDNTVMIKDGRRFAGPIELLQHHMNELDGFIAYPKIPCNRSAGKQPMFWINVSYQELNNAITNLANDRKERPDRAQGTKRLWYIEEVGKMYYTHQPWFHGKIERGVADERMNRDGHANGKFLIRERSDGTFALSLSHNSATKHYIINKHKQFTKVKLGIEDGTRCDNLMELVLHYHTLADGLLCRLVTSCKSPDRRDSTNRPLPPTPTAPSEASYQRPAVPLPPARYERSPAAPVEDYQKIYDELPRTDEVFRVRRSDLEIQGELGKGNFGSVVRGNYKQGRTMVPVAVKTLNQKNNASAEEEMMKEAKVMAGLDHTHIVRMIGVCRAETIMLVMELAGLGPLGTYLKKHLNTSAENIFELLFQVAKAMAYLESKNFVHRDLAARNVLLVNERFAKVSDFGMSRALGHTSDVYTSEQAGKWPLKWYAPECIYYMQFDSKSDVWSFGITAYEAMSFGAKPYQGMKGPDVLEFIKQGKRMQKPPLCPTGLYVLMLKCWQMNKEDRPTFQEIVARLMNLRTSS